MTILLTLLPIAVAAGLVLGIQVAIGRLIVADQVEASQPLSVARIRRDAARGRAHLLYALRVIDRNRYDGWVALR